MGDDVIADNEISVHLPHVMLLPVGNHQMVPVEQPACAFVVNETEYQLADKLLSSEDLHYLSYFVENKTVYIWNICMFGK